MPKKNSKSSSSSTPQPSQIPADLPTIVNDFIRDLTITFPEYTEQLANVNLPLLYQHFRTVFLPLYFDILNQNDSLFAPESTANTYFFPNIDFRNIMNDPTVSTNTRQSIWKYLQLILFSVTSSLDSADQFGEIGNLFGAMSEGDLHSKLAEATRGIQEFFDGQRARPPTASATEGLAEATDDQIPPIPDPDGLFDSLKGLLKGKIGQFAQELFEELKGDLSAIFSEAEMRELHQGADPSQLLQRLMKNPQKLMEVMKKIKTKFQAKMDSGEINQEDMMKEAKEAMDSMGGIDSPQFKGMFQEMAQKMGFGKNARMDTNRWTQMEEQRKTKERMRANAERRRAEVAERSRRMGEMSMGEEKSHSEEQKEIDDLLKTLAPIKKNDKKGGGKPKK